MAGFFAVVLFVGERRVNELYRRMSDESKPPSLEEAILGIVCTESSYFQIALSDEQLRQLADYIAEKIKKREIV